MSERIKTILLILFIVGVIGAFNAIISLSQNAGTSPFQTVGQALGLVAKPSPEPGRKFDFIAGELSKNQPATVPANNTINKAPTAGTPKPTPTPTPQVATQPIQTAPELPPLPPVGGTVKGIKTMKLPPLPPVGKKTLDAKTTSMEAEIQGFFHSAASFFGF